MLCGCLRGGVIENHTRNPVGVTLWTVLVTCCRLLVHVQEWVHILGEPQCSAEGSAVEHYKYNHDQVGTPQSDRRASYRTWGSRDNLLPRELVKLSLSLSVSHNASEHHPVSVSCGSNTLHPTHLSHTDTPTPNNNTLFLFFLSLTFLISHSASFLPSAARAAVNSSHADVVSLAPILT